MESFISKNLLLLLFLSSILHPSESAPAPEPAPSPFPSNSISRNSNGLFRNSMRDLFYPTPKPREKVINNINLNKAEMIVAQAEQDAKNKEEKAEEKVVLGVSDNTPMDPNTKKVTDEEVMMPTNDDQTTPAPISPPPPPIKPVDQEEGEDLEEDLDSNKTKRSKGLLQKLGVVATTTTTEMGEREFEAQMDGASSDDEAEGEEEKATPQPGPGLLGRLNPKYKIRMKVNLARNMVNRALGVVGLGGSKEKAKSASEDDGGSEPQGDMGGGGGGDSFGGGGGSEGSGTDDSTGGGSEQLRFSRFNAIVLTILMIAVSKYVLN